MWSILQMFFRVSRGVVDLREPSAQIDAVANVRQPRGGTEDGTVLRE
jgi:hypothetical protein